MGLPKLTLRTVNKYLKGLEKRCQNEKSLVTVTVTQEKRKINFIFYLNIFSLGSKKSIEFNKFYLLAKKKTKHFKEHV